MKTQVEEKKVLDFLKQRFNSSIKDFTKIKSGEISQAFSFKSNNHSYIVRINRKRNAFDKDVYAFKHFSSFKISIPKIIEIGKLNDLYYSLSDKAEGKDLSEYPESVNKSLLPEIISILEEIHRIDISNSHGYGKWDGEGNAPFNSWNDYLLSELDLNPALNKDFVDKNYFNDLVSEFKSLLEYTSKERSLVNGDYGYNNLISDGKKITGVIDWGESRYGDFVLDLAWLDFWKSEVNYGDILKAGYKNKDKDFENFEKRLRCYKIFIGITSIMIAAKHDDQRDYSLVKKDIDLFI